MLNAAVLNAGLITFFEFAHRVFPDLDVEALAEAGELDAHLSEKAFWEIARRLDEEQGSLLAQGSNRAEAASNGNGLNGLGSVGSAALIQCSEADVEQRLRLARCRRGELFGGELCVQHEAGLGSCEECDAQLEASSRGPIRGSTVGEAMPNGETRRDETEPAKQALQIPGGVKPETSKDVVARKLRRRIRPVRRPPRDGTDANDQRPREWAKWWQRWPQPPQLIVKRESTLSKIETLHEASRDAIEDHLRCVD